LNSNTTDVTGAPTNSSATKVRTTAIVVVAEADSVSDAYGRATQPFDEKRGGLGLALPLARRVIEDHGGRLWSPQPPPDADGAEALARGAIIVAIPVN